MDKYQFSRRKFFEKVLLSTALLNSYITYSTIASAKPNVNSQRISRIGIIGLDTSHSRVFTHIINEGELRDSGYRVVAAYPHGTKDIESALQRKPTIIEAVRKMGVEIVGSIDELLKQVDYVLLESNDGKVHLEQAKLVFQSGKRVFIDKPLAANLKDAEEIVRLSQECNVPFFSSSALRFEKSVIAVNRGEIGKVTGADVYTPAHMEKGHLDLSWYGIHGVEMLYAIMGKGCVSVSRTYTEGTDLIVGEWQDGRIGTIRGIRSGESNIAGVAFGTQGIKSLGPFETYVPLVAHILKFFESGVPPVDHSETLEIFKFMHAADKSKNRKGKRVKV